MMFLFVFIVFVTLTVLTTTASTTNVQDQEYLDDNTAFGYHRKIGIPAAKDIQKSEWAAFSNPSITVTRGSAARLGQLPYQVGLIVKIPGPDSVCGGSLISTSRVLTAAHCWFDGEKHATKFIVVLGSVRLYFGGIRKPTKKVVMHPQWDPRTIQNDIAMVYLQRKVSLSAHIATIALPSGNRSYARKFAIASGFGYTSDINTMNNNKNLSHVQLRVITNTQCLRIFQNIKPSNICTSGADKKNTCKGDSGGPLVVITKKKPILIGVTSFGSQLGCQVGAPAVFSRVSAYMKFIKHHL